MKILKYAFGFLMLALIINVSLAYAEGRAATGVIAGIVQIKHGETADSPTYYKRNDLIQAVKIDNVYTTATNPCPKCSLRVDLFKNNNSVSHVTLRLGQKKSFSDIPDVKGNYNYHLQFMRVENTLFTTTASYRWCMDVDCSNI